MCQLRERRRWRRSTNGALRRLRDEEWSAAQEGPSNEGSEPTDANIDALWRRFVREARSPGEARRARRAWTKWTAQDSGGSSGGQKTPHGTSNGGIWRDQASPSHQQPGATRRRGSEFFYEGQSWRDEYESFWEYGSGRAARSAGNEHPGWERWRQQRRQEQSWWSASGSGSGGAWARADVRSGLAVLGLAAEPPPTAAALKRAFLECAMRHHPDRHSAGAAAAAAERKFKEARAAFDLLQPLAGA
jgi:hypothetical protein